MENTGFNVLYFFIKKSSHWKQLGACFCCYPVKHCTIKSHDLSNERKKIKKNFYLLIFMNILLLKNYFGDTIEFYRGALF